MANNPQTSTIPKSKPFGVRVPSRSWFKNHKAQAINLYLDWSTLRALSLWLKILQVRKTAPCFAEHAPESWLSKFLVVKETALFYDEASHIG